MKFQLPFFNKPKEDDQLYLGLFLKEDEGVIFYIQKRFGKLALIATEEFKFSNSWENLTEDLDDVLYRLEKETRKAPDKTIFFVYSHFIDEKTAQIKRPYLDKIKTLVKNLDLKPMGYIDTHEAVVEGIAATEDSPLTAIVIELDTTSLQLFVYKGGRAVVAKHVARSSNLLDDIVPSLEEVRKTTVLPSRIIIYDSSSVNKEVGEIINHHWKEDFFMQMPKVEVISSANLHEYLMSVFSLQLSSEAPSMKNEEGKGPAKEVMGFVIGGEVEEDKKDLPPEEDLHQQPMHQPSAASHHLPLTKGIDVSSYIKVVKTHAQRVTEKIRGAPALPLLAAVIVILTLFCMEFFFHKATITLLLPSREVRKSLILNSEVDEKEGEEVAVSSGSMELTISESKKTTGEKEVGKKAHGEVTLHNFSDEEKTFTKNTTLTTDNLKFILIEDVKVASASLAADGSAKLPGKKKGSVEGEKIGEEYNIAKGKRFRIGDFAQGTYFGVNEADLTGGSKRQIQTVSSQDIAALRASLLKKTDSELSKKLSSAKNRKEVIINALTDKEISKFSPSAEVEQEAAEVEAEATVTATYYFFKDEDLKTFISKSLSPGLPKKYTIDKKRVTYAVNSAQKKGSVVTIRVDARARATSQLNDKEVLSSVRGKRTNNLLEAVKEKYAAQGVEYEISHPIAPLASFMPIFKKNIELKIEYP